MNGKDKRRAERVDANIFTEILNPHLKNSIGRGVVVDVSHSGMAIETESDLHVGEVVECHVEVPLKLQARIMRRITPGQISRYGLRFHKLGFLDKFVLRKILKGSLKTKKI